MSDKYFVGYGLHKGQTVYLRTTSQTEYEVVGSWQGYIVVVGPSGHPCLRKAETLTAKPPKFITVTFAEGGVHYTYKVNDSAKINIGDSLFSSRHKTVVKVVDISEGCNKSASFFKGFLLGDEV